METDLSISRGIAGAKDILGRLEVADRVKEHPFPFHTLNYWGDINHPSSRYSFSLNLGRYRELLSDVFELTPQDMRRIDIHIVGEGRLALPRHIRERILPGGKKRAIGGEIRVGYTGLYDDESVPPSPWGERPIDASIYLFAFWHFFAIERKMILKYVKSQQKEKRHARLLGKHMRIFTITDEMLEFLESSPDVVDARLRKLAGIKLREDILGVTAHEAAAHLFDTTKDTVDKDQEMRKKLIARLTGTQYTPPNIMDQFRQYPVVKRFLPNIPRSRPKLLVFEDLAKAIQEFVIADPKYRDLIDFEINPDWSFQNGKLKPVDNHKVGDVALEAAGLDSVA